MTIFSSFFWAQQVTPLQESVGLFDIMQKGGLLMWFIFLGSVLALAIFWERVLYYHRCRLRLGEFLTGILNLLRRRKYIEALERCDEGYGPVIQIIRTAILKRHLPSAELREAIRENAQLELPPLEAHLPLLATIGTITPLFGLLGTVMGMIEAFLQISQASGAAPLSDLANGIWMALITTAAGISVSIPIYVAYNYLVSRLHSILFDMERAAIEVVHVLVDSDETEIIQLEDNRESASHASQGSPHSIQAS